jgi:hypothetical protein
MGTSICTTALPGASTRRRCSTSRRLAALLAFLALAAQAAPDALEDACYVRAESVPIAAPGKPEPTPAQSELGWRRRTTRLFDVELTLVGPDAASCSVTGVARLRDGPQGAVLALPVRPDAGAQGGRSSMRCLVYLRATPAAAEVTTTEAACRAQGLCGGRVRLQGQRFESTMRVPLGPGSPCFAGSTP